MDQFFDTLIFSQKSVKNVGPKDVARKVARHYYQFCSKYRPTYNLILGGKLCPYCLAKTEKVNTLKAGIYKRDYGDVFRCSNGCDAIVGVHKTSGKPLGRLAGKELRTAKKQAHEWFDQIWKNYRGSKGP